MTAPSPDPLKGNEKSKSKSEISDIPRRIQNRSQGTLSSGENVSNNDETKSASEKEDENDDFYSCKICHQTFIGTR